MRSFKCATDCSGGLGQSINEYVDGSNKCQLCHNECSTCTGPDANNCKSCPVSKVLLSTKSCADKCPDKFFEDLSHVCQDCYSRCKTCSGSAETECLTCNEATHVLTLTKKCAAYCSGDIETEINEFVNVDK